MNICPANTAFVDAVRQACRALGRTTMPTRSVAVVPESRGLYSFKLVDITPKDPRRITVTATTVADNVRNMSAALYHLFAGGNNGDELIFLHEKIDRPHVAAYRWILLNPITMKGELIDDHIPSSEYVRLITD